LDRLCGLNYFGRLNSGAVRYTNRGIQGIVGIFARLKCRGSGLSRAGDPKTGEFEPAEVMKRFGEEVPAKNALMEYE
jgi:hypothetical protein